MVQQTQRSPHRDGDPAASHSDKASKALGPDTGKKQEPASWRKAALQSSQAAPMLFTLPARTEQNDLLREVQILTLSLSGSSILTVNKGFGFPLSYAISEIVNLWSAPCTEHPL